ncbi:MAG: phytanoyl-CoA dioxygenase family protein [Fimbriimonadaceae bacterium]|nr:phytanoyl-CoA dioxygenase family protein [Fimbriimonadaceae bacterium]
MPNALHPLTSQDVHHYHEQGYLLHRAPVFSPEKFAALTAIFEENLAQYGPDDLDTMHFRDPRLLDFLLADEVLDLVEPLIGPDIALWSSHFICKPARTGKATPWHEDSSYWNGRMDTMADIATVWLAIDPAFPENGSMGVIPGTHVNGFSTYESVDTDKNIFSAQVADVDESKAVYFTLDPNECSIHDSRIIHGAKPNTSDHRRCGYTMRYFPTRNRVNQEDPRNHGFRLWLARGKDIAGNRYENA